ncbi:MAG: phospholipase D-like domain-containing protein [Pseudomonadota bacterium]
MFFLIIPGGSSCFGLEAGSFDMLIDEGYFPGVKRLIDSAKKTVQIMMFEAAYYKQHAASPSNQLIQALMDARKRGVKVEAVLEAGDKKDDRVTMNNLLTGGLLKKSGIDVTLDPANSTTHTKLLIIDESLVVLGSTNWTYSALTKNHEVSTVIYSPEAAHRLGDYFQMVKRSGKKF